MTTDNATPPTGQPQKSRRNPRRQPRAHVQQATISAQVSAAYADQIRQVASADGRTLSDYIRRVLTGQAPPVPEARP